MRECISDELLKQIFDGMIESDQEIEEVFEHLENCRNCSDRLQRLQPGSFEKSFRELYHDKEELDDEYVDDLLENADQFAEEFIKKNRPAGLGANKQARFQLDEKVGSGHFFNAFKAMDYVFGDVIVKSPIEGQLTSDSHQAQFIQDALAAVQLEHPNIVGVLDFGNWSKSRVFVSSPFIEAARFDQWLQAGKVDLASTLQTVSQVCSALSTAMKSNVLHRHLDFRNIFVEENGHVWVTDFGFVLDVRYQFDLFQKAKFDSLFLPPEFFIAEEDLIDERSDVFSVGRILQCCIDYLEALGGDNPHPIPLKSFAPIIRKCTRNSRTNRFQNIDELIYEIRGLDSGLQGFSEQDWAYRR